MAISVKTTETRRR